MIFKLVLGRFSPSFWVKYLDEKRFSGRAASAAEAKSSPGGELAWECRFHHDQTGNGLGMRDVNDIHGSLMLKIMINSSVFAG